MTHAGLQPVDPGDLTALNELLGSGLRFAVVPEERHEPRRAHRRGVGQSSVHSASPLASGVLTYRPSDGRIAVASFPVACTSARRRLLHSLAGSLAECAMDLGLGTGVYRRQGESS